MSFQDFLKDLRDLCNRYLTTFDVVPEQKPPAPKTKTTIPQIIDSLPDDITRNLDARIEGDKIIVTVKQYFYDKTKWNLADDVIKKFGGRWVSAGKDSRWEVPK